MRRDQLMEPDFRSCSEGCGPPGLHQWTSTQCLFCTRSSRHSEGYTA